MKQKCYITPSPLFVPGTAERLLGLIDAGPIAHDKQGRLVCHLAPHQIELWGIKGGAHRLEIAPESEPAEVAAPPETAAVVEEPFSPSIIVESASGEKTVVSIDTGRAADVPPATPPTLETVIAAGYQPDVAAAIVARENAKAEQGIEPYGPKSETEFVPPAPPVPEVGTVA